MSLKRCRLKVDKKVTHDIQLAILSIFVNCHAKTDVTLIYATVEGTNVPYIRSVCDIRPHIIKKS